MRHRAGRIELICGSMFSGKTEELIRRVRRAQIAKLTVQVFKPGIDVRYHAGRVTSHNGQDYDAIPCERAADILTHWNPEATVVAVDEAQFFDSEIVAVAETLASREVRVIMAGLDLDFRGEPFGPMPILMAQAEDVTKLHAICVVCGGPASRNQRLIDGRPARYDSPTIMVGGRESYEARCRHCLELPRRDEDQVPLL